MAYWLCSRARAALKRDRKSERERERTACCCFWNLFILIVIGIIFTAIGSLLWFVGSFRVCRAQRLCASRQTRESVDVLRTIICQYCQYATHTHNHLHLLLLFHQFSFHWSQFGPLRFWARYIHTNLTQCHDYYLIIKHWALAWLCMRMPPHRLADLCNNAQQHYRRTENIFVKCFLIAV